MKLIISVLSLIFLVFVSSTTASAQSLSYKIAGTAQSNSYDNSGITALPQPGEPFYGQNANYPGNQPSYTLNGDGTVTDAVTGLMWEKTTDRNGDGLINYADKMSYDEALAGAQSCRTGGYDDWRLPGIKELYSLIMYYGAEPNPEAQVQGDAVPFIDTEVFDFAYGDLNAVSHGASSNERLIDAQYATATIYVSTTMNGQQTMFGVNFADGRIKGYPAAASMKKYYVMYVRGNPAYGVNQYTDNGNGTISDQASGLLWMKSDNATALNWEDALTYADTLTYAGYDDWRLPDAKELQSLVDYTRSPATTASAAIDPVFYCTGITNEAGEADYPYYWSSTTFCSQSPENGEKACYLSFGRAMGYMPVFGGWIDVHGAGAQRSDPKTGDPDDYPFGFGPQGDAIRIYNFVRPVRTIQAVSGISEINKGIELKVFPNPVKKSCSVSPLPVNESLDIRIYSISGEVVAEYKSTGIPEISLNLNGLPEGVYILNLTGDSVNINKKIIRVN